MLLDLFRKFGLIQQRTTSFPFTHFVLHFYTFPPFDKTIKYIKNMRVSYAKRSILATYQ